MANRTTSKYVVAHFSKVTANKLARLLTVEKTKKWLKKVKAEDWMCRYSELLEDGTMAEMLVHKHI